MSTVFSVCSSFARLSTENRYFIHFTPFAIKRSLFYLCYCARSSLFAFLFTLFHDLSCSFTWSHISLSSIKVAVARIHPLIVLIHSTQIKLIELNDSDTSFRSIDAYFFFFFAAATATAAVAQRLTLKWAERLQEPHINRNSDWHCLNIVLSLSTPRFVDVRMLDIYKINLVRFLEMR